MYQALYRKYRPNNFEETVGQDVIIKTLENEIMHNKLSHAYLFCGPRGTGKTSIAKILAKVVNCTNLNGFTPCNKCVICTQINNKQTTDIIEIDAASNNGVDEIRELKSKVNLVPSNSKYKIYIIDEVHMLTIGAFNALLKTLEEPPAHIIFILATTDPHKIPSTILSRCQRFDFKRISDKKIVERLKFIVEQENIKIEEQALYEIARLSDGGMRDSISMLDQVISYAEDEVTLKDVHEVNGTLSQADIKQIIKNIVDKNIESLFQILDECNNSGKNFIKLTEEIILFLRNLLLYKTVPNYFKDNKQDVEIYETFDEFSVSNLLYLIQEFNLSINTMKASNNPKMILELLIIRLLNNEKPLKIETVKQVSFFPKKETVEKRVESVESNNKDEQNMTINVKEIDNKSSNKIENSTKKNFPGKVLIEKKRNLLNELVTIRMNNALAGFSRKELLNFKNKEEILHTYLLNPDYSETISMIFDGNLKAFGNNIAIYVFPNERLSNLFNENLISVDSIFEEALKEKIHAVATYLDEWNEIKEAFNNKKKAYEYQEETISLEDLFEEKKDTDSNELESLFGDIVEYQ